MADQGGQQPGESNNKPLRTSASGTFRIAPGQAARATLTASQQANKNSDAPKPNPTPSSGKPSGERQGKGTFEVAPGERVAGTLSDGSSVSIRLNDAEQPQADSNQPTATAEPEKVTDRSNRPTPAAGGTPRTAVTSSEEVTRQPASEPATGAANQPQAAGPQQSAEAAAESPTTEPSRQTDEETNNDSEEKPKEENAEDKAEQPESQEHNGEAEKVPAGVSTKANAEGANSQLPTGAVVPQGQSGKRPEGSSQPQDQPTDTKPGTAKTSDERKKRIQAERARQRELGRNARELRNPLQGFNPGQALGTLANRYNPANLLKDQGRKQLVRFLLANPEVIGALVIIMLLVVAGVIAVGYLASPTGSSAQSNTNAVNNHVDILTLLAREGDANARAQLIQTRKPDVLTLLKQQLIAETDDTKKKIIQRLIDAINALKPGVDYSSTKDTTELKQKQELNDAYDAYQKIAPQLQFFAAAQTLVDWVAAHPREANQRTTPGGGNNCWSAVSYALSHAFPGSNPRGGPEGDAPWFDRGPSKPGTGDGPTPTDYKTANEALAAGKLPVWHVQGTASGQHWIVVLAADAVTQTITEYDPAYGRIVTLNPSQSSGPSWISSRGGNYLGYSALGANDNSAFQRGFAFTPKPAPNQVAKTSTKKTSAHVPPVLMYHDVVADNATNLASSDIRVSQLKDQVSYLKSNGYKTLSMDEFYAMKKAGQADPKSILITFDDGYIGNYNYAKPILESAGFKATFFVHTDYVGTKTDRLHMSWDQLKTLDAEALFKVYSHTLTHPDLKTLSDSELDRQLRDSQKAIVDHLGGSRPYLAYPFGRYDSRVIAAAQKYYSLALGVKGPLSDSGSLFQIPRIGLGTSIASGNSLGGVLNSWLANNDSDATTVADDGLDGQNLAAINDDSPLGQAN